MKVVVAALAALSGVVWLAGGSAAPAGPPPPAGPGDAHPDAPPPGHTGGFGEPTCQVCHAEYALNVAGGELAVEGVPEAWEPGAEYVLTVVLRSEEMGAAGFQLSARTPDGRTAGRFAALDDRVAVDEYTDSVPPTAYARHTRAGSRVDDRSIAAWRILWTAPSRATEVRFHGAANSGNGDNSPFGDLVYTTAFAVRAVGTSR